MVQDSLIYLSLFAAQSPCRDMPDVLSTAVLLCTVALLTNVVRLPAGPLSSERLSVGTAGNVSPYMDQTESPKKTSFSGIPTKG
jgi:hypothetical protein